MRGQVLIQFLMLFFIAMLFIIGYFITSNVIKVFPSSNAKTVMTTISNTIFGTFDNSILFILAFLVIVSIIAAYRNPSIEAAIGGFIFLLASVFVISFIQANINLFNFADISTNLPGIYTLFTSNYLYILIIGGEVIAVIMNSRKKD